MKIVIVCTNRQRRRNPIWQELEKYYSVKSVTPESRKPKPNFDAVICTTSIIQCGKGSNIVRVEGKTLAEILAEVRGEPVDPPVDPENETPPPADPDGDQDDTPDEDLNPDDFADITDAARALCSKHGVYPGHIPHLGPRVTKPDVEAFLKK